MTKRRMELGCVSTYWLAYTIALLNGCLTLLVANLEQNYVGTVLSADCFIDGLRERSSHDG